MDWDEVKRPSRRVILALRALTRCVRNMLQLPALEQDIFREDEFATSSAEYGVESLNVRASIVTKVRDASPSSKQGNNKQGKNSKKEKGVSSASAPAFGPAHPRTHDYDLAAGLVFAMGMVQRLLEKYPAKQDSAHLLYLLTQLREGELPLAELSRENLRGLVSNSLKCQVPTWPQFDSLCQRFDPQGKVRIYP